MARRAVDGPAIEEDDGVVQDSRPDLAAPTSPGSAGASGDGKAPPPGPPPGPGAPPVASVAPPAAPVPGAAPPAAAPQAPSGDGAQPPTGDGAQARQGPPPLATRPGPPTRAPVALAPPKGGRGPRVVQGRRSRRVVRRIDAWTVLKLSFCFYLSVALVLMIAGVVLWNVASAFNVITNIEKFIRQLFDLQTFRLRSDVILAYSALGAGILVILGTGINVLMAVLYNLISDIIGGVQVIVLEEQDNPRSDV